MLADLVKIKALRADRAEQFMQLCRCEAIRALAERVQAEKTRDTFEVFRDQEEMRRYAELMGHAVRLRDIEGVHEYLALLREELRARQHQAEERAKAHQAASHRAQTAQETYSTADRARQKMLELAAVFDAELAREMEYREEQELEELVESRREKEEWDGLSDE